MAYAPLTGTEAVELLKEHSEALVFPIAEFPLNFGISQKELLKELQAGRLIARGERVGDDLRNIHIPANSVVSWWANPKTPPRLLEKVRRHLASHRRPN